MAQTSCSILAGSKEGAAQIADRGSVHGTRDAGQETAQSRPKKPKDRADSVRTLLVYLGLGEGSTIADIGAGKGRDTWVFADIVGETRASNIMRGLLLQYTKGMPNSSRFRGIITHVKDLQSLTSAMDRFFSYSMGITT